MANDNIFQQYLTPPKSVMDYTAEMDQADSRRQAMQQNALTLAAGKQKYADYQREREGESHLSRLLSAGGTPDQVAAGLAQAGYGKQALAYTKQQQDLAKEKEEAARLAAATGKLKSETQGIDYKLREEKRQKAIVDMTAFEDPQQVLASLQLHEKVGDLSPEQAESVRRSIPQNPADFAKWQVAMLRGIMSAKDAAGQIAPDANTVANNLQSDKNSMRGAATAREANRLKADENRINRDGVVGKRTQDVELKLQDDYRAESKGFAETSTAMKKVFGAIETADKNPGSALAAGTAFMKILDPNSVVRESELGMALNASGWFDRATHIANTLRNGRTMTAQQKVNLKAAAEDLFEEAKAAQLEVDSAYRKRATDYGADPARVIVDRGQNTARAGAPTSKNDVMSAADAILKGGK